MGDLRKGEEGRIFICHYWKIGKIVKIGTAPIFIDI